MTRLSEGGYAKPADIDAMFRKTREMRYAPQMTTPTRARAKASLDAAVKKARAKARA